MSVNPFSNLYSSPIRHNRWVLRRVGFALLKNTLITSSRTQSALLAWVLFLTVTLVSITSAAPTGAVSTGVCWAWNMDDKATGNFLTDGSHDGVTAVADTYTLIDFKVNSSIYPTVEVGSISDGTYIIGYQPPISFVWSGTAPTVFQRQGYIDLGWNRLSFSIFNDPTDGSGAWFAFGIGSSGIRDEVYGTIRYSSSNTILLSPTVRSACDAAPAAPVVAYEPPAPIQFLTTLSPPKLSLSNGNLLCTAGEYRSGYTIGGVIQGDVNAKYEPGTYVFNLFIDGVPQSILIRTSTTNRSSWDLLRYPSGTTLTCSVTVTVNSLTVSNRSTENIEGLSAALSVQRKATFNANDDYSASLSANSKAYQIALVDNRATWRKEIAGIRTNYYETLNSIKANGRSKMITDASTALKIMITAQRKSAADYAASKPAAIAAKDAANKVALSAKTAAIANANAIYGSFI